MVVGIFNDFWARCYFYLKPWHLALPIHHTPGKKANGRLAGHLFVLKPTKGGTPKRVVPRPLCVAITCRLSTTKPNPQSLAPGTGIFCPPPRPRPGWCRPGAG